MPNNTRIPKRVGGVQKVVDQWLKLKAKAVEVEEKLEPLTQKIREVAREMLDRAEAQHVDARTMRLDGTGEGAAVEVVFTSRSKVIPAIRASRARSVLGGLSGHFLKDKLEVTLSGDLARFFLDQMAPAYQLGLDRTDVEVAATTSVSPEFLDARLRLRDQLDEEQLTVLRELQDNFMYNPNIKPHTTSAPNLAGKDLPAPPPPPPAPAPRP